MYSYEKCKGGNGARKATIRPSRVTNPAFLRLDVIYLSSNQSLYK